MSDISRGPGWWQTADGRWYAPERHPDYLPPPPVSTVVASDSSSSRKRWFWALSISLLAVAIALGGLVEASTNGPAPSRSNALASPDLREHEPVRPLRIVTPRTLPGGTPNVAYRVKLRVTGGHDSRYDWALSPHSAKLPTGLVLHGYTGVISGTPSKTDGGTYTFTVWVRGWVRVYRRWIARNARVKAFSITIS